MNSCLRSMSTRLALGLSVFSLFVAGWTATPFVAASSAAPVWVGGSHGIEYRNLVIVLTWHDVMPVGHYDTVSTASFASEIKTLSRDGFHAVTANRFAKFVEGRSSVPPNAVLLTFDNGDAGVYRYALPILEKYRDPILFFPIFGRIGIDRGFVTPSELKAMVRTGLVTLGSHTYQQHNGIATGPNESEPADVGRQLIGGHLETLRQYEARIIHDAALAQAAIQQYEGQPEPYFSDPFGQYTPSLLSLIAKKGFTFDFTTLGWGTAAGAPADRIPRINVGTVGIDGSAMVGSILDVAHLTVEHPSWHPPATHVVIWR